MTHVTRSWNRKGSAVSGVNMKRSSLEEGPAGPERIKMKDWQSQAHVKWERKYDVGLVERSGNADTA